VQATLPYGPLSAGLGGPLWLESWPAHDTYTWEDSHYHCYNFSFWFHTMCSHFGGFS